MTIEQRKAAGEIETTVPLERGHLVIVDDNINTEVVS